MLLLVYAFLAFAVNRGVHGTFCYSCVYSYPWEDDTCVTDPANAPQPNIVSCDSDRLCRTFRQWDTRENVVRSFSRSCDPPPVRDSCVEDTFFITCNTYCQTDLCNDGDGTKISGATSHFGSTKSDFLKHYTSIVIFTLNYFILQTYDD
jgi:hypothetical protein